ncbi:unnamed protein product [Orchesella dallaii]|uniref:Uncharacterized protein n=1 Tax=Orchesella dallaii TaxID=48710 RepID=A0ABP1R7X7_9HEXA
MDLKTYPHEYCKAFDENFRPIICLIKNGTNTPPPNHNPHPPNHHPPPPNNNPPPYPILQPPFPDDSDYDDEDCSCEVTCVPIIVNQRSFGNFLPRRYYQKRKKRTTTTSYRCKPCGAECPVATSLKPRCNCVIPASKAECTCSANCAMFRYEPFFFPNSDDFDDVNCIISVSALEDWRLGEERPPYSCECQRSKEAENSRRPDFVCICQRVPFD